MDAFIGFATTSLIATLWILAMMHGRSSSAGRTAARCVAGASMFFLLLLVPSEARASLLSPEAEDKLATFIALFVLFVVPVVLIVLFWMVHILPEKIAHQRHHPQFEAIRTLCLLSLVFGGLLWPFAWLWAYSKPVMYKIAYGTDTHPDADKALPSGGPRDEGFTGLRDRVARLEGRIPAAELEVLRADLASIEAKYVEREAR